MAKSYSDLWKKAGELEKEGEDVADFNESVAKLPYGLKDEFRKAQDPKLDEAINKAQSDTFGAAIKGLDMYQGISNPFQRRALAEQYQGGIEMGWKNLTDERTRRQGVYADYITKWTGLYGAEAAKRQDSFNNKLSIWEKEKSLADAEESTRRWNYEQSHKGSGSAAKSYTDQEITATVAALKSQGKNWDEINSFLVSEGIDTVRNSYADKQMRSIIGGETIEEPKKEQSWSEKNAEMNYQEKVSKGNGTKENPYKSSSEASNGDYYWSGTTKKKKVNNWFDTTVND